MKACQARGFEAAHQPCRQTPRWQVLPPRVCRGSRKRWCQPFDARFRPFHLHSCALLAGSFASPGSAIRPAMASWLVACAILAAGAAATDARDATDCMQEFSGSFKKATDTDAKCMILSAFGECNKVISSSDALRQV